MQKTARKLPAVTNLEQGRSVTICQPRTPQRGEPARDQAWQSAVKLYFRRGWLLVVNTPANVPLAASVVVWRRLHAGDKTHRTLTAMNTDIWIDRLYQDASLTDNLQDQDAERLLSWAESQLMECDSDGTARQLLESIRLLDHYVGQGRTFDELFLALKANTPGLHPSTPTQAPSSADPNLLEQYPIADSISDEQAEMVEDENPANSETSAPTEGDAAANNRLSDATSAADSTTPTITTL